MKKRTMIFVTAMVLVLAMATGATFAYLFAEGDPITNTFEPTRIGSITVSETGATDGKKNFTVVPGVPITKDPKIKYSPDSNTPNVGTIVVFATLDLAGTTWSYASNKFTYTDANKNTLDFTINTTNWLYVGRAGTTGNKHVLVYKKVLDGTEESSAFEVINGNKINVSEGWTEEQLATAFGAGGVKITVSSSVSQAKPNITGAVGNSSTVTVANAKKAWNAISSTDIP